MDGGADLGDDVFGTTTYEAALPLKKEFLPWHRPRKQLVRKDQWCHEIGLLLDTFKSDDGRLRYLGLPGADLLDIRSFHSEICIPRNLRLRFLGFNSAANPDSPGQPDLNVSADEVRKLELVDPASDIIWDDFTLLANPDSFAWKRASELGPYDVINLDLCDGFGGAPPGRLGATHYNAVNRMLSLQARRKHPWLLLLTTRVNRTSVHDDVLEVLLQRYLDNLSDCPAFLAASKERFSIASESELRGAVQDPPRLVTMYLVGICKWLIGLTANQAPPSKIEVRDTLGYRVNAGAPCEDLMSLAVKLEPSLIPGKDPSGLALQPSMPLDECVLATRALKLIGKRRDADEILNADTALHEQMIEETAALLHLARYDVAAYRRWVLTYS